MTFGLECFSFLLSAQPIDEADVPLDLLAKDDQGYTAMHVACEYDLSKAVEQMLASSAGAELAEAKDRLQNKPIHSCASNNSIASGELSHISKVVFTNILTTLISHLLFTYSKTSLGKRC